MLKEHIHSSTFEPFMDLTFIVICGQLTFIRASAVKSYFVFLELFRRLLAPLPSEIVFALVGFFLVLSQDVTL